MSIVEEEEDGQQDQWKDGSEGSARTKKIPALQAESPFRVNLLGIDGNVWGFRSPSTLYYPAVCSLSSVVSPNNST